MSNRFDYVEYDPPSQALQIAFKGAFQAIENYCDRLRDGRAKALVLTKLEEAYMWVGKAIRDEQIQRNGSAPLQEGRGNE